MNIYSKPVSESFVSDFLLFQLPLLLSSIQLHPRLFPLDLQAVLVFTKHLDLKSCLEAYTLLLRSRSRRLAQLNTLAVFLVHQMEVLRLVTLAQKEILAHLGVILLYAVSLGFRQVRDLSGVAFQGSLHRNVRQQ